MTTVADELRAVAADAGVTAWVSAHRIGEPESAVSWQEDVPVPMASLYKLPLALGWAQLVTEGGLDPLAPVLLSPENRSPGLTGVAMLLDEVRISQRDAVRLMLAVSDNACSDLLLRLVGRERLARLLSETGLADVEVRHGSAESLRIIQRETGATDPALAERALASPDVDVTTSEYDAALASAATAAGICRVLDALWRRSGPAYDLVRDAMAHQAWRHRIGSGFPHDDVVVHGKTGTLARLRHEAAVVAFPGEQPVAVTVLTRAARAERHLPRVDAAIGELARIAVGPLRRATETAHPAR
ncbi:class A beta-lactamase-related serine hydrolase [Nocardioides sp. CER19]|uniref:class A beta-lactamase-related serine hydrolase n=1 Tax=Nocardioides sp. CER19 TaxID=3038538 RepID=UPI002449E057|nr:class A beta-lactamase-related serine hydrolase [Nocardioides sp. CER19]MDH2412544.1 class A beta-lactamase-related serine hydrolase [Nocardioides sp. CER19]